MEKIILETIIYKRFGFRMWIYFVLKTIKKVLIFSQLSLQFFSFAYIFPKVGAILSLIAILLLMIPFFIATIKYRHYSIELTESILIVKENFFTKSTNIAYSNISNAVFYPKWTRILTGTGMLILEVKELETPTQIKLRLPIKEGYEIAEKVGSGSAVENKRSV